MTITIYKGNFKDSVILNSKDKRFAREFGTFIRVYNYRLYDTLVEITAWARKELNEQCVFEVDYDVTDAEEL